MSQESLSQADVESLLGAPTPRTPAADAAVGTKDGAVPPTMNRQGERILPYDFRRPERVGKEQMRALHALHEGLGRSFGVGLSTLMRTLVDIKLTSVDQLTYGEFIFSLDNPTCFNLIRAEPLNGFLILELGPSIVFPMVDRLLGGTAEKVNPTRRPLTEIERRLIGRVTALFLSELRQGWEQLIALELSVEKMESNPQLVQVVPPSEVVILVTFELVMGGVRGMLNLCIPFNCVERLGSRLTDKSWATYGRVSRTAESKQKVARELDHSRASLDVTLARTTIRVEDLLALRIGDVITTDHDIRQPLEMAIEGSTKFLVSAGAWKDRKAVKIEQILAPPAMPPETK